MSLTVTLPKGEAVPALGQGTWQIAENAARRAQEIEALRLGVELGMTLIDTAEMYGEGAAEELVAEALAGQRERLFLVSKVYPHNASRRGVVEACERSLKRLKTDRLDLYLLHWRGSVPLEETVTASRSFAAPARSAIGASATSIPTTWRNCSRFRTVTNCATNQVLYNVTRRGPEFDLLPWMTERGMPLMAYSPIEQGRIPRRGALQKVAEKHGASAFQIALAWLLQKPGVIAIPKASSPRTRERQLPRA